MKNLNGTKTEANLREAFAGESQARSKYFYFAAKAREEGHDAAARYFEETAVNEQEHAKIWFKFLTGIGATKDNLQTAITGEHSETSQMYPDFAKTAKEEGFDEIAALFEKIATIEKSHEDHFRLLLNQLGSQAIMRDKWKCDNCGNIIAAKNPPESCPVCGNSDIPWSGYKAYKNVTF